MKRTFVYTDEKSSKFWTIDIDGDCFTVTFGKTGTAGQTSLKSFDNEEKCLKAAEKLIAEKTGKGYVEEGKTIYKPQPVDHSEPKLIPFLSDSKYGFCTPDKRVIIPAQYNGCRQFSEGLACVKIGDKCGAINMRNELVIPAIYDNIGNFYDGITFAYKNSKCGFIDHDGKEIVPFKNNSGFAKSSEGMIAVQKGKKWGFYNTRGEEVAPCIYDEVEPFKYGYACVMKKADQTTYWGAIDKTGKEVVPVIYQVVRDFSEEGLAVFNGKDCPWGFVDGAGKRVIPPQFKFTKKFVNGIAAVKTKDGWGFINTKGEWVIDPVYSDADSFSDGLAAVYDIKMDKSGYINTRGELVIPFAYKHTTDFSEGLAFVSQESEYSHLKNYSIIDKTGKVVGKINDCVYATPFKKGVSTVKVVVDKRKKLEKCGVIDKTGKPLSGFRYDNIYEFVEGVAIVTCSDEFEKYAFIDLYGTEFWEKDDSLEERQARMEKEYKEHKTPAPPAGTILDDNTFPKYTELIAKKTAEKYYQLYEYIQYPFMDFPETEAEADDDDDDEYQEIRIFKGDLYLSAIESTNTRDWGLYSLIVDGDLIVDGIIDWAESRNGSFIYVTGNVKAGSLIIQGNAEVYVKGDVEITNGILCFEGDDGGYLTIEGKTKARFIVCTTYFNTIFRKQPEAILIGDVDDNFQEENSKSNFNKILKPEYLEKNGNINEYKVKEALKRGEEVLVLNNRPI